MTSVTVEYRDLQLILSCIKPHMAPSFSSAQLEALKRVRHEMIASQVSFSDTVIEIHRKTVKALEAENQFYRNVRCSIDDCKMRPGHHVKGYPDDTYLCDDHLEFACDCDFGEPSEMCRLHSQNAEILAIPDLESE